MADSTLDLFGQADDPAITRNAFRMRGLGPGYGHPRTPDIPPLDPEVAEPLKEKLLRRTVSGLHYFGSTMDKLFGARALRGLAAGKPHELLSAIPGSDTFGLTKPEDSVSMDDLLTKHYKVFKPNDPTKWEFRDFAIPLAEIAADPGTYLMPLGALTKAGRLAKAAGLTRGLSRRALTEGFTHTEPALKALGNTADDIAELARRGARVAPESLINEAAAKGVKIEAGTPLRGALGFGLPFREARGAVGTGGIAKGFASFQDWAGRKALAAPGIRTLRPLFDSRVMRAGDPVVQEMASGHGTPAREAIEAAVRSGEYDLATEMDSLLKDFKSMPGVEHEAARVVRGATEESPIFANPTEWRADLMRRHATVLPSGRNLAPGVVDPIAVADHIEKNWARLEGMAARIRRFGEETRRSAEDLGVGDADLADPFAHYAARRYIAAGSGVGGPEQSRQFLTMHGSNMHRKGPLRDVPGASTQLDEWAMDPRLSGPGRTFTHDQVKAHVLADMLAMAARHTGAPVTAADHLPKVTGKAMTYAEKANEVARWLQSVPAVHAEQGIPYFNPDIVGDYAMRGMRHAHVAGGSTAAIRSATAKARPAADFAATGERHVLLGDFLNRGGKPGLNTFTREARFTPTEEAGILGAGFPDVATARAAAIDPTDPLHHLVATLDPGVAKRLANGEWYGAAIRGYEQMAPRGFGPVREAISGAVNPIQKLNEYALSEADADSIARFMQGWVTPTEMSPILKTVAGANQIFKNMVYPIWLASHTRNLTSALYNNALHGVNPRDYLDALRVMRGRGAIDPARFGLAAGMSPADAAHALNRGAYADAKVYTGINSFDERVGARGLHDPRLARGMAGDERLIPTAPNVQAPLGSVIRKNGWQNLNPLAQAGVLGQAEDKFLPLVVGRRVGSGIEDFVRMANYLGGLRRGLSSAEAGDLVRRVHFDYSDLAPFERNVAKPLIPFYSFMRNNTPYQLRMAATRPGSVTPTLRAMGATDPNRPWVPEYLASGAAYPVGEETPEGQQRYASSFGLPVEEALSRFKFKNYELPSGRTVGLPSLGGTLGGFFGEFSPYLKAPFEAITGHQLKSGRPLADLKANRILSLNGQVPDEYAQPLTQLVANSPLARFFSTAQTLMDERKRDVGALPMFANLLTGVRFSDVDLARQKNAAYRSVINELLRSDPRVAEFVNFYTKPEFKGANMPPDLAERLGLFGTLKREGKEFHRRQAEEAQLRELYGNLVPSGL